MNHEVPDLNCQACSAALFTVSLDSPVDYEYGVKPAEPYVYLRCAKCGSEWLFSRPDATVLPSFYPENYHAYNDDKGLVSGLLIRMRGWLRGRKYRSLLSNNASGRLFDVGAGDCRHFLELSKYAQWEFAGVEIQAPVAEVAREAGYDIVTGTLEGMDIERHLGRYDVVSMNHVLEHVENPIEVLDRCRRLLRPGGYLVGQLPTNSTWETCFGGAWAGYHFPRHLQVFSRTGLEEIILGRGFSDVRISSAPHCQTAISMQNMLLACGVNLDIRFGRSKVYGLLLALSLPLEAFAWLFNRSGTLDFVAQRPDS